MENENHSFDGCHLENTPKEYWCNTSQDENPKDNFHSDNTFDFDTLSSIVNNLVEYNFTFPGYYEEIKLSTQLITDHTLFQSKITNDIQSFPLCSIVKNMDISNKYNIKSCRKQSTLSKMKTGTLIRDNMRDKVHPSANLENSEQINSFVDYMSVTPGGSEMLNCLVQCENMSNFGEDSCEEPTEDSPQLESFKENTLLSIDLSIENKAGISNKNTENQPLEINDDKIVHTLENHKNFQTATNTNGVSADEQQDDGVSQDSPQLKTPIQENNTTNTIVIPFLGVSADEQQDDGVLQLKTPIQENNTTNTTVIPFLEKTSPVSSTVTQEISSTTIKEDSINKVVDVSVKYNGDKETYGAISNAENKSSAENTITPITDKDKVVTSLERLIKRLQTAKNKNCTDPNKEKGEPFDVVEDDPGLITDALESSAITEDNDKGKPARWTSKNFKTITPNDAIEEIVKKPTMCQITPKSNMLFKETLEKLKMMVTHSSGKSSVQPSILYIKGKQDKNCEMEKRSRKSTLYVEEKPLTKNDKIEKKDKNMESTRSVLKLKCQNKKRENFETKESSSKEKEIIDEDRDNNDPGWESIKKLNTEEERYKAVKVCWNSKNVPNPHRDLTHHSHQFNWLDREDNQRKRKATSEPEGTMPPAKRKRTETVLCTDFLDRKIKNALEVYEQKRVEEMSKYFHSIHKLSQKRQEEQGKLSAQYTKKLAEMHKTGSSDAIDKLSLDNWFQSEEQYLLDKEGREKDIEKRIHDNASDRILVEYKFAANKLKEAKEEVLRFNQFYCGLNNLNPTILEEKRIKEAENVDIMYKLYDKYYGQERL